MANDPLWMEHAAEKMKKKGTKGSFGRAAKAHGMSTQAYAHEKAGSSGTVGKRARMALAFAKARH